MAERVVVVNRYSWVEPNPHKPGEQVYYSADRGQTIELSDDEVARGEALGALSTPEALTDIAERRAALEAELAALNAQVVAARAQVAPAAVAPPEPARSGVVLTPAVTGVPTVEPLPGDQGPLAPATPSAVDAARAVAQGLVDRIPDPAAQVAPLYPAAAAAPIPTTADPATGPADPTDPAAYPGGVTDEQLAAMNVDRVLAHLGQHGDDVDRVEDLEKQREKPRTGVLDAIGRIRAAS